MKYICIKDGSPSQLEWRGVKGLSSPSSCNVQLYTFVFFLKIVYL